MPTTPSTPRRSIPPSLWIALATLAALFVNRFIDLCRIPFLNLLHSTYPGVRLTLFLRVVELLLLPVIIWGIFKARKTAWFLSMIAALLANLISLRRPRYGTIDFTILILVLLPVLANTRWFLSTAVSTGPNENTPPSPESRRSPNPLLLGCLSVAIIFALALFSPARFVGMEFTRFFYYAIFAGVVYAVVHEIQASSIHAPVRNIIIFLAGLAILAIPEYLVIVFGYRRGVANPADTLGNIFGILVPFFAIIQFVLVLRIGLRWGRAPVAGAIQLFLLITALQLPLSYGSAYLYGQASGLSKISRIRSDFFTLAKALENYRVDKSSYPPALDSLTPVYMKAIPQFANYGPLRYTVFTDNTSGTSTSQQFFLWVAGVDGKFDIEDGAELHSALRLGRQSLSSPWLSARTYDPSNGSRSGGDLYRFSEK